MSLLRTCSEPCHADFFQTEPPRKAEILSQAVACVWHMKDKPTPSVQYSIKTQTFLSGLSAFILALMTYPKSGEEAVSKTLEEELMVELEEKSALSALLYLKRY